jgi:hypothetical protein
MPQTVAISTSDHRLAALFYDRVVPLHSSDSVPESLRLDTPNDVDTKAWGSDLVELAALAVRQRLRATGHPVPDLDDIRDLTALEPFTDDDMLEARNIVAYRYKRELQRLGIFAVPLYHSEASYQGGLLASDGSTHFSEAVELRVTDVPLIDTSALTWEHIIDIRSDKDFTARARRFRLFLTETYAGKSPQYVKESLLDSVYQYERACRKHGLELFLSTVAKVLESKSLLGSLGLAAVALITGNPAAASAAAIGGAVVEVGKVTVHIAQKKLDHNEGGSGEIAFLLDLARRVRKRS